MLNIPFDVEIALRYVRGSKGQSRDRFISFISGLAMIGIGLGVAALIIVLSVMNGFQKEVRDRMLAVISHIEVVASNPEPINWAVIQSAIQQSSDQIVGVAPFVEGQTMISYDDLLRPALVRGIDPTQELQVSDFNQVLPGDLSQLHAGRWGIILGQELALSLGLSIGQKITLLAPSASFSPAGFTPRLKSFEVVAFVNTGHYEYDSSLVLMHVDDAAKFYQTHGPSGLRIKLNNMHNAPEIASKLQTQLGNSVWVKDWSIQNRTWFAAVKTEKRMMFIILTLIIAVAAFNLVSMLVMTVKDKRGEIAILRTLGASPFSILKIFILQGALVGWIGTLLGALAGWVIASNLGRLVPLIEQAFQFEFLPKSIYFISQLPSDPRLDDLYTIILVSLLLSVLSTIYPAWRAAKAAPAEALRYE